MSGPELVTVGRVGRPRGLDGELFVSPETDFPDRFVGLKEIYVKQRDSWHKRRLESSRLVRGRPVVRFAGVKTPEQAALLTNSELAVTEDELIKLPPDEHYLFELVGCKVINDKTGEPIGEVIDVEQYPANDAYLIEKPDGTRALFPVVRQFVKKIDMEKREILIDISALVSV
ncbi:MAG: ribosome maturation factor RimM [Candidatus Zixiibacteriota bacterium]